MSKLFIYREGLTYFISTRKIPDRIVIEECDNYQDACETVRELNSNNYGFR